MGKRQRDAKRLPWPGIRPPGGAVVGLLWHTCQVGMAVHRGEEGPMAGGLVAGILSRTSCWDSQDLQQQALGQPLGLPQ